MQEETPRLCVSFFVGHVISFDSMNDYYDLSLKEYRLAEIEKAMKSSNVKHTFIKGNFSNKETDG